MMSISPFYFQRSGIILSIHVSIQWLRRVSQYFILFFFKLNLKRILSFVDENEIHGQFSDKDGYHRNIIVNMFQSSSLDSVKRQSDDNQRKMDWPRIVDYDDNIDDKDNLQSDSAS